MDTSALVLSKLTSYMKYQRFDPMRGRKETWTQTIERNKTLHLKKYATVLRTHPTLRTDLERAYDMVTAYKVLPSMRSMQFAGPAILQKEERMYNCAYLPLRDVRSFSETLYLLLCGAGVGYSVQRHHIEQLPRLLGARHMSPRTHVIRDSIEGWADAVTFLMESFMDPAKHCYPLFDGSKVRPKGAMINSIHVRAPGPGPLLESLARVRDILSNKAYGSALTSVEVMDIVNILGASALAGGIRRSAMICLFSPDDYDMLYAKDASTKWWITAPWRAYSNNSAVILRDTAHTRAHFERVWSILANGRSGEPGVFFTNDHTLEVLTNPCVEISLNPYQFCNLTEVNGATITSQEDFNERTRAAALLGTLQAGYTSFNYLRPEWRATTVREALLGVGLTGIANGSIYHLDATQAAREAVQENARVAPLLGLNKAARVTTVKPSGSTSLVFGCASGIHSLHAPYYVRRLRISKGDDLYGALLKQIPDLVTDDCTDSDSAVVSVPIRALQPGASYRSESPMDFLERIKRYQHEWVCAGHQTGVNTHNVSATVSLRSDEWDVVREWLWRERYSYSCISVFPLVESDSIYKQTPFEECDERTFRDLSQKVRNIDLDDIGRGRTDANTSMPPLACAGGACEL